nr:FecR domain-containing protein [Lachnospiraceae bacterium]
MKKKMLIPVLAGALIIIGVALFFVLRSGEDSYFNIRILYSEGNVSIKRDDTSFKASKDMKLRDKDYITVASDGFTRINCDRETYAHFEHDTEAVIKAASNKKLTINMVKGELVIDLQQKLADDEKLNVVTPNTTLAIRGTVVAVRTYPTE